MRHKKPKSINLKKFKAARERARMTIAEAGVAIGMSRQTVYNWEIGSSSPNVDYATALARLYHCSLSDMGIEP